MVATIVWLGMVVRRVDEITSKLAKTIQSTIFSSNSECLFPTCAICERRHNPISIYESLIQPRAHTTNTNNYMWCTGQTKRVILSKFAANIRQRILSSSSPHRHDDGHITIIIRNDEDKYTQRKNKRKKRPHRMPKRMWTERRDDKTMQKETKQINNNNNYNDSSENDSSNKFSKFRDSCKYPLCGGCALPTQNREFTVHFFFFFRCWERKPYGGCFWCARKSTKKDRNGEMDWIDTSCYR